MIYKLTASAAVLALTATTSFAATLNIAFEGQGESLTNDSLGVDFIGNPVRNEAGEIDFVSAGRGADIVFSEEGGNGFLEARSDRFVFFEQGSGEDFPRFEMLGELAFNSDGSLRVFSANDVIGADTDVNWDTTIGTLYDDAGNGAIANVDDTGFFGFRFTYFENSVLPVFPVFPEPPEIEAPFDFDDITLCTDLRCDDDGEGPFGPQPLSFYGFVQITHGSVIPGSIFVDTTGNTSITVATADPMTPVPLPAAGWMLLAGLGGLVAAKRRKKA